jgi:hypothetical protein
VRALARWRAQISATLQCVRFLLELLAELPRHGARAPDPAADGPGKPGQFLRPEHDQRDTEDHQYFGEVDPEHCAQRT